MADTMDEVRDELQDDEVADELQGDELLDDAIEHVGGAETGTEGAAVDELQDELQDDELAADPVSECVEDDDADLVPHDDIFSDAEDELAAVEYVTGTSAEIRDELDDDEPGYAVPEVVPSHEGMEDELMSDPGEHSEAEEEAAPKKKKGGGDDPQEMLNTVKAFLGQMENAYEADMEAYRLDKPGFMKVSMLQKLNDMISMTKLHELLLQAGVLGSLKAWLEPLESHTGKRDLPHAKVRVAVYTALSRLPLDTHNQESRDRLKSSKIGPVLAFYSKCSVETAPNRSFVTKLVNRWISPIVTEGRQDVADRDAHAAATRDQLRTLKQKRKVEKEADQAENERLQKDQEGLKVGDPGYRYHARIPKAARLDYVKMPTVPEAILQRMAAKPEKETGTRAELKKQFLKVQRSEKTAQRSSHVVIK